MIRQIEFTLRPRSRGFHPITDEIEANLPPLPAAGLLHLFIKHTSAGLSPQRERRSPTCAPIWKRSSTASSANASLLHPHLRGLRRHARPCEIDARGDGSHASRQPRAHQPGHVAGDLPVRIPQSGRRPAHRRHGRRVSVRRNPQHRPASLHRHDDLSANPAAFQPFVSAGDFAEREDAVHMHPQPAAGKQVGDTAHPLAAGMHQDVPVIPDAVRPTAASSASAFRSEGSSTIMPSGRSTCSDRTKFSPPTVSSTKSISSPAPRTAPC